MNNLSTDQAMPLIEEGMGLGLVVAKISDAFSQAGINTALLDGRLLLQHVASLDHGEFIAATSRPITGDEISRLLPLIERRLNREPISRIFGEAEFWSLPFHLSKDTLDPRPDTETLVELAIEMMQDKESDPRSRPLRILDLGTGTGCILLSLLSELPKATGVGVDISEGAVLTATRNAEQLGLSDRADFQVSNWFDNVCGRFDLIVSNPPYIPASDIDKLSRDVSVYDPRRALDGGVDGLAPYKIIFENAADFTTAGTCLVVEFGMGQKAELTALMEGSSLASHILTTELRSDLAGIPRCLAVKLK